MNDMCITYCTHGGICELDKGHEGPHDSGSCQWSDGESISREEANARLAAKGPEGAFIALMDEVLMPDE